MGRTYKQDLDRASIEELAATLESKIVSDAERVDDEAVALAERRPDAPRQEGAPSLPPVLVAHADPLVRASARAALERHFQVLEAEDGEAAWDILAAHHEVRVLLTGTRLPRLDGIELIRRLRRPNGPTHLVGLPIMVYAAVEDPAEKQTVLLAGANDYLLVDTEREALLARVQARNRLFEQSRRAMNLTGTKPTARPRRTEPASGTELPPRVGRLEPRPRGSSERPIWVEARGGKAAAGEGPGGWAQRLYRISSTTTITLTATVLVILGITFILLFNQTPQRPQSLSVGRLGTVPPPAEPPPSQANARIEQEPRGAEEPATPPPAQAGATRDNAAAPRPQASTEAPPRAPSAASTGNGRGVEPSASVAPAPSERNEAAVARREAGAEPRPQTPRHPLETPPPRSIESPPRVAAAPTREEPPKPALREPQSTMKTEEPKPAARGPGPTPPALSTAQSARTEPEPAPRPANVDQATMPRPAAVADVAASTDSVAAAPPVAANPPPRPAPVRLTREELATLLQRFVSVYEAGDIEQFMALLADNIQTNDRITRQAVREDYARLFRTTDLRQMRIETMNWDVEDDQAHGWGEFEVRVRRQGDATVHHYQGSITVQVRKAGGRPRIERLYHSERRASR